MASDAQQAKAIFLKLADRVPPNDWESCLDDECAGNGALKNRVRALLQAHAHPSSRFSEDGLAVTLQMEFESATDGVGQQIGPYKLLEVIGEGGMGTVYLAEQTEPVHRRVALKLIKAGMDTRQVIARFEAERQTLALMDHPNIARVLDAGSTDSGRPYFVMELVKGKPITEFCDENRLDTQGRLDLFRQVCHAVQHAHQKGIIHRDIKPSNVLVAMYDDQPVPKVIDFGVAKATNDRLTEKTLFTRYGQIIGTLEYMSPEQAKFNNLDIDTRSDIYSLGAILYELLTGEPPFEAEAIKNQALDETLRMIREDEPTKPSIKLSATVQAALVASCRKTSPENLGSLLRGELDWIVMKSLAKDRSQRYESASAFADDVQRHLDNEPVLAGPPSATYRFRKFATRNRSLLIGTMIATVGLVTATVISFYLYLDARQAREEAIAETHRKTKAESVARREATTATVVNEFVNVDLLGAADPEIEPDRNLRVRDVLNRAAERLEDRFQDQPLVEAAIRRTMGKGYRSLGIQSAALEQLEKSLALYTKHLGEMDIETLKTELDLLLVIHDQQHYQRVRERLEQIQNICQETLGIEAPLTLRSRWQLAEILNHLGEHRKAVEICEHDLPICLEVLPDNDQTTLRMISNLAAGERSLGDKQHAERSLLALIPRVRDAIGGDDNPAMIRILRSLGRTVALQNRHAEAERWFQRVLALQQKVLGNHHPDIFETRIDIAASHFLQGDRDAAITMIRTIADEQAEVLGADDPRTLTTRQKLALLLSQHDGPNQAIEEYEKLVPLVRATLDPEHPTRTAVIDWYGKSLEQVGRHDAFEDLLREELKAQNQALGPEHMATRRTVSTLREMFERNDDPDAATGLLQRQIDVLKEDRFRADPFDRALLLAQYCAQAGLVSAQHDRLEEAILYWTEESKWRELADQLKPGNLDNLAGWGGSLSNMAQARLRASENTLTPAELEDCLTQLESAEQKLAVVLAAEPTHVVATKFLKITTRNLAKTCVESDRFELAAEYFKSLAELTTGTDRIKNIRNQVNALIRANRLDAAHDLLENGFEKLDISDDDRLFMAGAYARCLQANRTNSETSVQFPAHPQPLFRQSAMALLKKLVADRDKLDPRIIAKLRWGDEFNSLREDEEFISLLAQLPTENKAETEAHIPGQH